MIGYGVVNLKVFCSGIRGLARLQTMGQRLRSA